MDPSQTGRPIPSTPRGRIVAPFVVWLVLYVVAGAGAVYSFRSSWFAEIGPGGEPPWYFIGRDAHHALWSGAAAVLMLLFTLVLQRRLGPNCWMALGIAIMGFSYKVGSGANILLHTKGIGQQSLAWSAWPTFDAYFASQNVAYVISMGIGIALGAACIFQYTRALRAAGGVH